MLNPSPVGSWKLKKLLWAVLWLYGDALRSLREQFVMMARRTAQTMRSHR